MDVLLIRPTHLGCLWSRASGYALKYKWARDVWRPPTPLAIVPTMLFYLILLLFFAVLIVTLSKRPHHLFTLEATDNSGATLILGGKNVGLFDAITAAFRGGIKAHLHREMDTNISIPHMAYRLANTSHPPLTQDWEETATAALSSTRELIEYFKRSTGPDEAIHLYPFIQSITLLTFLRLFFRLPITFTNIQEVLWIVGGSPQTDGCCQEFVGDPVDLRHLIKSSPNPCGVLAVLSATQRLVLSALCLLERQRDNIHFIRQAKVLLQHPASSGSEVIQLVQGTLESHPPVQSVCGGIRLSLGHLPLHHTYGVDSFIPIDALPLSSCIMGPDGACISWLHKAALPGQPGCGGRAWLIRATAIILSAVETGIRQANLTIDGDNHDPEAWEEWDLRRLRVG